METIITKIIICSGVLLGLYYLFLAKEKTLVFNRFYLIFSLIFSVAIPFFTIQAPEIKQEKAPIIFEEAPVETVLVSQETPIQSVDYSQILLYLYGIITAILLVKLIVSFIKIKKLKGRKMVYKSRSLVLVEKYVAPFSFWKTIYISEKSFAEGKIDDQIFLHEEIHIRQKHSLDLLLVEVVKAILWFNPFVYLYKNAIVSNHEFLADEEVITKNKNIKNYQELILKEVLKQQNLSLTHQFNFNNTKKRFIMMTKQNSKFAKAKRFLAIPVFALAALAFAEKVYGNDTIKNTLSENTIVENTTDAENPNAYSEYIKIMQKYYRFIDEKDYRGFNRNLSQSDKAELFKLYNEMSYFQQDLVPVAFKERTWKIPKKPITDEIIEKYQDEKKYLIRIDGIRIKNADLRNYDKKNLATFLELHTDPKRNLEQDYVIIFFTEENYKKRYNQKYISSIIRFNENTKPAILDTIVPKKAKEAKVIKTEVTKEQVKPTSDLPVLPSQEQKSTEKTPAEFPDGIDNFRRSIGENFNHARFEKKSGIISTSVMISIDENGNTTNVTATGDDAAFNEESVRTIKFVTNNKTWKPATENGKPVKSVFKLPLKMAFSN